jgi:hypothetical protein
MQPIADAMFDLKITSELLPLIPFSEWLEKLDLSAKDANEENINRIVSVLQCLNGMFSHSIFYYSLLSNLSTTFTACMALASRSVHLPLVWPNVSVQR